MLPKETLATSFLSSLTPLSATAKVSRFLSPPVHWWLYVSFWSTEDGLFCYFGPSLAASKNLFCQLLCTKIQLKRSTSFTTVLVEKNKRRDDSLRLITQRNNGYDTTGVGQIHPYATLWIKLSSILMLKIISWTRTKVWRHLTTVTSVETCRFTFTVDLSFCNFRRSWQRCSCHSGTVLKTAMWTCSGKISGHEYR